MNLAPRPPLIGLSAVPSIARFHSFTHANVVLAPFLLVPVLALGFVCPAAGQIGEWVWMGGNTLGPVSGTLGIPWAGNPGGISAASSWTGRSDNIWFFGGWGDGLLEQPGYLDQLWEW